jgi:hydroxymethylbilane synthase
VKLRLGTRGSDLALWQARFVAERLTAAGHAVEIEVLQTRGDRIDDVPLHQVEGKAFFTAEIEAALLEERIDLAVHSHKDLPVVGPPELRIAAVPRRGASGERLLVAPAAHAPDAPFLPLRLGARVGTSSPRRTEQLRALRPDLALLPLRGNVPTRVRRLREGRFDAILLAAAGLDRLRLDALGLVACDLPLALVVPAPAQGALAVQVRARDEACAALCRDVLHDPETERAIAAERALLLAAGGGCNLPLGCAVRRDGAGYLAEVFAGPGVPEAGAPPRWATACAETPEDAVRAAWQTAVAGAPTQHGPLAGLRVALAGSAGGGTLLGARLCALGARVVHERVLDFAAVETRGPGLAARLRELRPGDALVVTSREAARRLAGLRVPDGVAVAAVGPATARALSEAGFAVSCVGEGGARELAWTLKVERGARVLFPCAADALTDLEDGLGARGVTTWRHELYRSVPRADVALTPGVDARVYLSPSAAAACREAERGTDEPPLRVALGPTTARACARLGLEVCMPARPGAEGVVHVLAGRGRAAWSTSTMESQR